MNTELSNIIHTIIGLLDSKSGGEFWSSLDNSFELHRPSSSSDGDEYGYWYLKEDGLDKTYRHVQLWIMAAEYKLPMNDAVRRHRLYKTFMPAARKIDADTANVLVQHRGNKVLFVATLLHSHFLNLLHSQYTPFIIELDRRIDLHESLRALLDLNDDDFDSVISTLNSGLPKYHRVGYDLSPVETQEGFCDKFTDEVITIFSQFGLCSLKTNSKYTNDFVNDLLQSVRP